jgi:O-antigen/teichoic acid export membrane protein
MPRVGGDAFIYGLGGFAGKAAAVVLMPILARALGPNDYGRLDVVSAVGSALTVIMLLGLDAAATRLYVAETTQAGRRRLLSTWLLASTGVALCVAAILFVSASRISVWLTGSVSTETAVQWLAVVVPAGMTNFAVLNIARLEDRPRLYAALSGSVVIANAALAILAVGILSLGVVGAVAAWAISLTAISLLGLWSVRRSIAAAPSRVRLTGLLALGLPLVPALGAVWGVEVLNRAVLLDAAGADAVGRFSVALRIASIVGLIGSAFLLAWQPRAYTSGVSVGRVATEAAYFVMIGAAVVIALTALSPVLAVVIAGESYNRASSLIGALSIAALAATAIQLFSLGSMLVRKSIDLSLSLLVSALVGFGLNLAMVSAFSERGTVLAIAIGQTVGLAAMTVLARRRSSVPYEYGWLALGGLVTVSAVAALSIADLGSAQRAIVLGLGIGSIALITLRIRGRASSFDSQTSVGG